MRIILSVVISALFVLLTEYLIITAFFAKGPVAFFPGLDDSVNATANYNVGFSNLVVSLGGVFAAAFFFPYSYTCISDYSLQSQQEN